MMNSTRVRTGRETHDWLRFFAVMGLSVAITTVIFASVVVAHT